MGQDNPGQADQVVPAIGDLYARIEQYPAAERWYRQVLKSGPESFAPLAMSLAKQGRIRRGRGLCEEAGKSRHIPAVCPGAHGGAVTGRATPGEIWPLPSRLLKKALEAHPDQPALLASVANIRVMQRTGTPMPSRCYRQILLVQPRRTWRPSTTWPLCWPSSPRRRTTSEALECIEQAIELIGPQPVPVGHQGHGHFYAGKLAPAADPLARRR